MTTRPTVYCNACGAENPTARGACLLCYALLHEPGHGLPCPACGHDNPKDAQFCSACGNPFAAGANRVPGLVDSALAVLHGGVAALTAHGEEEYEEEDYLGGMGAPEEGHEEALAEPVAAPPPAPVAPAPAPELDEDMMGMPPSALDLEEAAPPPPPPAPAPAAPAPVEEFVPPPAAPLSLEEEDMIAPPPPPGVEELVAPAAPPPAPPAAPAPPAHAQAAAEPAAETGTGLIDPLAQASAESADEDFGDWSLEFPEEKTE